MELKNLQPEMIGKIQGGKFHSTLPARAPQAAPEPAPTPIPEEKKTPPEETPPTKVEVKPKLAELEKVFSSLMTAQEDEIASLRAELEKATENQKKQKTGQSTQIKALQAEHKLALKGKDAEIADHKKMLAQKEKEVKKLFAQVKEALYAE